LVPFRIIPDDTARTNFMNRNTVIFIGISLCSVFFMTGCKSQDRTGNQKPAVFQKRINEFVYDSFGFEFDKTRSDIIKTMGRPARIAEKKVTNIHDPAQVDSEYVLFYAGLSIKIYEVSQTGKEIVTDISITTDQYKLKWGLRVGCSQDEVKRVLGEPHEKKDLVYVYEADEAPSIVVFFFRDGNVTSIDWEFYYD
jgi:hypothetical protein